MHQNFYHWHARAELKPDVALLSARWAAAKSFAEDLTAQEACSLLQLALSFGVDTSFSQHFAEELVKAEPTFPPSENANLLRVMATAALYTTMEKPSSTADAVALGLRAANFPAGRVEPVCGDLLPRAAEYLAAESERMRPRIYAGVLEKSEGEVNQLAVQLKAAAETKDPSKIAEACEALGSGVTRVIKESHTSLGAVIERLAEENQFLWWLVSERSPTLNAPRNSLKSEEYALPAAAEAIERVLHLPPPASAEGLLSSVLSQCKDARPGKIALTGLAEKVDERWKRQARVLLAPILTPIAGLLSAAASENEQSLGELRLSGSTKVSPIEASQQYFIELAFLRALAAMG